MGRLSLCNQFNSCSVVAEISVTDSEFWLVTQMLDPSKATPVGASKAYGAALRTATKDLENLGTTSKLADNVQNAYDAFNKAYPQTEGMFDTIKRLSQGVDAVNSMKPLTGNVSLIEKAIGGVMASPE